MSSPFVVPYDRTCTDKKCEPFFIREWETMLIGALICGTLLYLMSCSGSSSEPFAENNIVYDRRGSRQAHMAVDDRPGHDGTRTDMFTEQPKFAPTKGEVLTGKVHVFNGPSTSKFMDFAKIDAIDSLSQSEVNPSHMPETGDSTLELLIR